MACLPVSTIALSGVITRIPLVCMSIVDSAFQYGCAPTFTPATTTLTSRPAWVCSTRRRRTRATQSRFSLPLSMAIFAPADRANHSIGTSIAAARSMAARRRRHSGSAIEPIALVGSPSTTTRRTPSGWRTVGDEATPTTTPALFAPAGRSTGTSCPSSSRSCSTNEPSVAGEQRDQLVRVDHAAPTSGDDLLVVVVERLHRHRRRLGEAHGEALAGLVAEPHHHLGWLATGAGQPALDDDLLDAQPLGVRRQPADDGVEVVERDLDHRPDEEHHPVPLQSLAPGALGVRVADAVEACREQVLHLRQRGDVAVLVVDRGEVAHLGDGDEAHVVRVVAGHALEQEHVGQRRHAADLEVAQPPHVQPAGDHRVHPAELDVLLELVAGGGGSHPERTLAIGPGSPVGQRLHGRVRPVARRRRRRPARWSPAGRRQPTWWPATRRARRCRARPRRPRWRRRRPSPRLRHPTDRRRRAAAARRSATSASGPAIASTSILRPCTYRERTTWRAPTSSTVISSRSRIL